MVSSTSGNLNVFKGKDSMRNFFNPDLAPPLPLVEISDRLNPLRSDGVRIYAKMMTALPCQNVKNLPALNMLMKAGPEAEKTIVEPSSGSTVTSMAMIARVLHGNKDVHAYVSNKTERSRLRTLQFFGLKPVLYGGPAQPDISDPRGEIHKIKVRCEKSSDMWNPGQYQNLDNPEAHIRWTGPQLMAQLPEINVFCAGMGSAGCITGTGTYLKSQKASVTTIGVCNKMADAIPGPRPSALFANIDFPWKAVTDAVREVSSVEAYKLSMELSREGLICGPSSGMALQGLVDYLLEEKANARLQMHADPGTGEISCVFPCCDLPYQYMDKYFDKLRPGEFHAIENEQLCSLDQGAYSPVWEVTVPDALQIAGLPRFAMSSSNMSKSNPVNGVSTSTDACSIVDLRTPEDFSTLQLAGSINRSLEGLEPGTVSPFDDVAVLESQAKAIEKLADALIQDRPVPVRVLVVCYNGETSRLASSIMRQRGIESYSLKEGFTAAVNAATTSAQ